MYMMKLWHMNTVEVMEVPRNELDDDISARSLKETNDDIPAPPSKVFGSWKSFKSKNSTVESSHKASIAHYLLTCFCHLCQVTWT